MQNYYASTVPSLLRRAVQGAAIDTDYCYLKPVKRHDPEPLNIGILEPISNRPLVARKSHGFSLVQVRVGGCPIIEPPVYCTHGLAYRYRLTSTTKDVSSSIVAQT